MFYPVFKPMTEISFPFGRRAATRAGIRAVFALLALALPMAAYLLSLGGSLREALEARPFCSLEEPVVEHVRVFERVVLQYVLAEQQCAAAVRAMLSAMKQMGVSRDMRMEVARCVWATRRIFTSQ